MNETIENPRTDGDPSDLIVPETVPLRRPGRRPADSRARGQEPLRSRFGARLEAWLESEAPDRFEPGERYFFGHKIPRGS